MAGSQQQRSAHALFCGKDSAAWRMFATTSPPRYFEDQIAADRSVQRSLKEPRTLLVEGIGSKPTLAWNPTEVEFLDSASGQTQRSQVRGMEFFQPGSLKLPIVA